MKKYIAQKIKPFLKYVYRMGTFLLLLILYLVAKGIMWLANWKFFPKFIIDKCQLPLSRFYSKATKFLNLRPADSITRIDLIELAIKNMRAKKTRTLVTVGGMMIGIGAIVFLVSIGYGLQQLVITRVARLEEMRQADVTPQSGGKVKINDKTLSEFKDIAAVKMSLPLIAVVGRVNYQNSVSDMAVYGVTTDYLEQSAIRPVRGTVFDNNKLVVSAANTTSKTLSKEEEVSGVFVEKAVYGKKIQDIDFVINPNEWVRVREDSSTSAPILGYTKRVEGKSAGTEIWGDSYESDDGVGKIGETENGTVLGKWIKAPVLLWKEQECDLETEGDCENGKYVVLRDDENKQVQKTGFFAEINLSINGTSIKQNQVLGIAAGKPDGNNKKATETTDAIDWVEIASEAGVVQVPDVKTIKLASNTKKQAVASRAMLKVLGINESEAVGKKFMASFVVVGDLLSNPKEKIESAPTEYTIVGITPEEKTPFFYVPFIDLKSLGIVNYSQVKVVVENKAELAKTRTQIESMGYSTRSVADTVEQINSLFNTLRNVLMLLGMVALAVAALGMFNTLTVSLLERTREVGLMKAMGMKSSEVQELFLTESMIMGFFGGIFGIALGGILGKLVSLGLSFFAIFKGVGLVDISHIPISFVFVIILLSLLVGIATGIYPAKRATKISALNALRYE
jgi:ABC-type antimicrobial peptide transport system permease subunit